MALSRRGFVRTVGLGGAAGVLLGRGVDPLRAVQLGPAAPSGTIRLNGNENPYGLGPGALDAITRTLPDAARYGRNESALVDALAERHGVDRDWVLLSAGSGDLLRAAVQTFTDSGHGLVAAEPTFEPPVHTARRAGVPVRTIPVDGELRTDVAAMTEAAPGAGLVYLCNPNNPTSTAVSRDGVARLATALASKSPDTIVLVDEAYADYAEDPAYGTAIELARTMPQVLVVRTFSKVFAMAGLRVGYAIAQPATLARLRPQMPVMALNVLGVAAATAALRDEAHLARQVALNREGRARTTRYFEAIGCRVARSQTNFVMVDVGRPITRFGRACLEQGVQVGRPFPPLDTWARITIGTADEMTRALDVFARILRPSSA